MLLRKLLSSRSAAGTIPSLFSSKEDAASIIIIRTSNRNRGRGHCSSLFSFCSIRTNSWNRVRCFCLSALHGPDLVSTANNTDCDITRIQESCTSDCDIDSNINYATSPKDFDFKEDDRVPKVQSIEDLASCLEEQGLPSQLASAIVAAIPSCKRCQVNFHQLLSLVSFLQTMDMEVDKIPVLMKAAPFMYQQSPTLSLEPKIRYLESLGIHRKDMCRLILKYPYSLYRPLEIIKEQVQYLQSLSMDDQELHKIIKKSPLAFRLDAEKHLRPRLEFLKTLGVFPSDIKKAVLNGSRILSMTPEKLQKNGSFLQKLGFRLGTENFSRVILRCGPVTCKTLQEGLKTLSEVGFTQEEVELLVARLPLVLSRNKKDTCNKIKYLVEVMNRLPNEVLYCPVFLMLSLDKRIRPRHEALLQWKKTKKVSKEYSLSYVFLPSDKVLSTRFPGIKLKTR